MPSLGFLKKKRTREQNSDPSNTSQPNSPVTPTTSKTFDSNPVPASQAHASAASATSQLGPAISQGQSHQSHQSLQSQPSNQSQQGEPADKPPMHNSLLQHHYVSPPQPTPSPGTQPQNLPRIANLINPPQHDGSSQSYQHQLGSNFPLPPANNGAPGSQQYPPIMSQPQQQQQQQQQIQDQPRVTKGKYSLADFEILRTLGTGSFGRVHLVQSRHNQRFYAVKVLKKAQVVKMKQVEHTNDERKMLGEVKHPFLITLWGTFQDAKNLYMVMDFVEGGELFSLLRKSGVSFAASTPFRDHRQHVLTQP
jgi:protein kinase A